MKDDIIYTGIFFDAAEVEAKTNKVLTRNKLTKAIPNPHVTVKFRPKKVNDALFGIPVKVTVVGYASDGENEGVAVQISEEGLPQEFVELLREIPRPHITLSISNTGISVNTARLDFKPCQQFTLTGKYQPFCGF